MKYQKGIWLAAGLLGGALALTGCTAQTTPVITPTPDTAQKITAQPESAAKSTSTPEAAQLEEETPDPLTLSVGGEELRAHAIEENGKLLLPLIETAQVIGWMAEEENTPEDTQTKYNVVLTREDSVISVSWVSKDNSISKITWQKDGLLIPVNAMLTTVEDVVYVPAAFFEEAMGVRVAKEESGVAVTLPEEKTTPDTQTQG